MHTLSHTKSVVIREISKQKGHNFPLAESKKEYGNK